MAFLVPVIFFSCKKNDDDAVLPVEGKWSGSYGNDNDPPSISYMLTIKHGGVIEEVNATGQVKGSGSWNLDGNTFTAHYQWKAPLNTVFTITAIYNPVANKLTGEWGFDNSSADGGKWEANKTN